MSCVIAFLHDWQTLITGFIAIAAAFIGGYFITEQMRQTADLDADRRARELAAARAMLPLHLASMTDHARAQARVWMRLRRACGTGDSLPDNAFTRDTFPEIAAAPTQTALFFENMVLKCDPEDRARFAEILEEVQVSDSRLASFREKYLEPEDSTAHMTSSALDDHILEWAHIYARANALFPYARAKEIKHEPSSGEIFNALMNIGLRDFAFPSVFAEQNRRAELQARRSASPDAAGGEWN